MSCEIFSAKTGGQYCVVAWYCTSTNPSLISSLSIRFISTIGIPTSGSTILEIGTLIGYSAIRIARLLPRGGRLICIEKDAHHAEMARMNLERAGLSERVEIIVDDAKRAIPRLHGTFDVVFIDAEKSEYYTYLKLVEPRLHRGSVVVADNAGVFAREMKEFLSYVRQSGKYESRYHEFTMEFDPNTKDGVEVSTKL